MGTRLKRLSAGLSCFTVLLQVELDKLLLLEVGPALGLHRLLCERSEKNQEQERHDWMLRRRRYGPGTRSTDPIIRVVEHVYILIRNVLLSTRSLLPASTARTEWSVPPVQTSRIQMGASS